MIFSPEIEKEFSKKQIDRSLTLSILKRNIDGKKEALATETPIEIPEIDNKNIIDRKNLTFFDFSKEIFIHNFKRLLPEYSYQNFGKTRGSILRLTKKELEIIGILLYPKTVFGILNGGSATSYIDRKKNQAFNPVLFSLYKDIFTNLARISRGKAKGITPAFIQKDGTPGPSFMELKLRALLVQALRYQIRTGKNEKALFPFFQMTSIHNNQQILDELARYRESPYIKDLVDKTGIPITDAKTGIQPLLPAFTPPKNNEPLQIFTSAWGKKNSILPLPGGHGQNFSVLKEIYREMHAEGKRFAYLGNIDNLGSTVDPVSLAILAMTGKEAAFDFSYKTPVDIKGGILIREGNGKLNCVDIGPAISSEEVKKNEISGKSILFNCATGLFNLDYLVKNLDMITENLPLRFSVQDKDAGYYSQAEQVTWEIMGLMDDFLVFAVDKYKRFLAAKILMESILTSGIKPEDKKITEKAIPGELLTIAERLHSGLENILVETYELTKTDDGIWVEKQADLLASEYKRDVTLDLITPVK